MVEVMTDVGAWVANGRSFHEARTRAIELRADEWVRRYGKETADSAVQALHQLRPDEFLTKAEKARKHSREVEWALAHLAHRAPDRNTAINRAWIRWTGHRLYILALAAILALEALPGPATALARGGDHEPSRWRLLALCGVAKAGPARDRACERFNSTERTFRSYDAPAGTPREWELPRSWSVER